MSIAITEDIIPRKSTSFGCSCKFYKITSRTGFKLFRNKKTALASYLIHKTLSEHKSTKDFVPKVRSELVKINGKHGYAVELVKTEIGMGEQAYKDLSDFAESELGKEVLNKLEDVAITKMLIVPEFVKIFSGSGRVISYIQHLFEDNHCANWGIKGGKFVWIDFSINYFN